MGIDHSDEIGCPARASRTVKTGLPFVAKWNKRPLWKRALEQRGSLLVTGKRGKR